MNRTNLINVIKIIPIVAIILFSSFQKYKVFDEAGGDFETYRKAVIDFTSGENPYKYTVMTYEQPEKGFDHGYAYLPSLLYVQTPLYLVFQNTGFPLQRLWKLPVLAADIGIGIILCIYFYKKNYLALIAALLLWFFNPFFLVRNSYTNTEPLAIFFMLLSLFTLDKNEKISAVSFAAAVSFKTFPIILLPIFLFKAKNKVQFLGIGAIFAFLISVPFLKSVEDFTYYIKGSVLVHGDREIQGRPILSYITYYTQWMGINFLQTRYFKFYVYLAILSGWVYSSWQLLKKKIVDPYILSTASFLLFYLFTPVLSRTHLLWFLPIFIIALYNKFNNRRPYLYYALLLLYFVFYFWYLSQWITGVRFGGNMIFL